MKKLFITMALVSAVAFANAQEMMSKKGTPILPEAGDWSIGFDAGSILTYAGSLFGHSNGSFNASPQVDNTLVGLYVKDATMAYRGMLRIGIGSRTQDNLVTDDASTTAGATVTDEAKSSNMNVTIGAGLQWTRGKGRLHGIYGAQLMIALGSDKTDYTYGNAFTATVNNPTSTYDFSNGNSAPANSRTTEDKSGSTFGFGINGFVGAEYFFAPKMSLSAEYGWGIMSSSTGEGEMITETLNTTANGGTSTTSKTGKSSSFGLDVINSGSIIWHLYF